jgi:hypothetical protein
MTPRRHFNEMERELVVAQEAVRSAMEILDGAVSHRAVAFALAAERGVGSGAIARLTGATPQQAMHAIRVGRGLIRSRRSRHMSQEDIAA